MKPTSDKIIDQSTLRNRVKEWQAKGDTVVFTNGCFDIVHLGHIDYLEKAKALGGRLVVGLNADKSVKELKGEGRPVNNIEARSRMLAAFEFVDAVTTFDEMTPQNLIEHVLPDFLVKGDDYSVENIVGAEAVIKNGGAVKTIGLVEGYSTSNIIDKIKK